MIKLLALLSLLTLVMNFLSWSRFFDLLRLDTTIESLILKSKEPISRDPSIVIVAIDKHSKERLNNLTWDENWRQHHDELIKVLSEDKAKVIGFDFCVNMSSEYDSVLAQAIKRARAGNTAVVFGVGCKGNGKPTPTLYNAASGFGTVSVGETDAYINKLRVFTRRDTKEQMDWIRELQIQGIPSFALQVIHEGKINAQIIDLEKRQITSSYHRPLDFDEDGYIYINFLAPPDSFPTYPYYDVMRGKYPSGTFTEKTVLVGIKLVSREDYYPTLYKMMHGVEIQANAINTILQNTKQIRQVGDFWKAAIILGITSATAFVFFKLRAGSRWKIQFLIFIEIGIFPICAIYLFKYSYLILDITYPVCAILLTSLLTSHFVIREEKLPDFRIKILFLAANPLDTIRLRLDEEIRAIDEALRQAEFRDKFDIRQHWAIRVADLQGCLLRHQPDIVHFSGHGSDSSEIILEDDSGKTYSVSVRALNRLFSVFKKNIRCVFLNACYSERQALAIVEQIDCVIGMSLAISDVAAISFAKAFYQALGYGKDVKTAFELGCTQIDMENLGEQDTPKLLAKKSNPGKIVFVKND